MVINSFSSGASLGNLVIKKEVSTDSAADTEAQAPEQAAAVEKTERTASSTTSSSSMMSGLFYDSNYERSKYVEAGISSRQQENSFSTKMNSLVSSLVAQAQIWDNERQFGGAVPIENTYLIGQRLGTASTMATNRVKSEETNTHSEKNLDDLREGIEQRAEEATTERDEDAASTEGTDTESNEDALSESSDASETTDFVDETSAGDISSESDSTGAPTDQVEATDNGIQSTDIGSLLRFSATGAKLNITV